MEKLAIESISNHVIFNGRTTGTVWFHPRACRLPAHAENGILMTAQGISGSDHFQPVHWMYSKDNGHEWSPPAPIPGFGRTSFRDGVEEGVCDVVPEAHLPTGRIIAIGHNVFYREDGFFKQQPSRWPVYNVWDPANRTWGEKRKLAWDNPDADRIYTCGCAQRYTFASGDILIPLSYGSFDRDDRRVCTVMAGFDGKHLIAGEFGPSLELRVNRGLLEPTVTKYDDRFYMTIRAEDDRGYAVRSDDGLSWSGLRAWSWDDGEPLVMSTTQQRWITHSEGLFLVYTRKDESNLNVMRWRAPLFIAQVDTERLCLIRASERIAIPLRGDGIGDPDRVARLGNFHTVNATIDESWITVGETVPSERWRGDTILSRITWSLPNQLVD